MGGSLGPQSSPKRLNPQVDGEVEVGELAAIDVVGRCLDGMIGRGLWGFFVGCARARGFLRTIWCYASALVLNCHGFC